MKAEVDRHGQRDQLLAYLRTPEYRPTLMQASSERYLLQLVAIENRWMTKEDTWFDADRPQAVHRGHRARLCLIERDATDSGISAVLLFGSRARGDNSRGSDTDLLLVSPPGRPRHRSSGHLSMFFYPWPKLLADARDGDLFVCHLTMEAQPIFDPTARLERLRAAFTLRPSYDLEIAHASEVGWLIDRHADELVPSSVVRRMLWCVRTILIARSAERGEPVFAPARLATTTSSAAAADLLVGRHQRKLDTVVRRRFRRFLAEEANAPLFQEDADLEEYERQFRRSGNTVGVRMLQSKRIADETYI